MNVTAYALNVAASALLAGSVWAQNPTQNPLRTHPVHKFRRRRRDNRPGLLVVCAPRAPFRPTPPKGKRSSR